LLDRAGHTNADVVVDHIEAAIALEGSGDHRRTVAGLADICQEHGCVATFAPDHPARPLGAPEVLIDAEHACTLAGEQDGGCLAITDATALRPGASHDCHFSLQATSHDVLPPNAPRTTAFVELWMANGAWSAGNCNE